jgi:hypothetical protein
MGFDQVCVCRRIPTFSSDLDERVFLCPLEDVKRKAYGCYVVRLR